MESAKDKVKIWLGDFPVIEMKVGGITINIGKNVHLTFYVGDFPHKVKVGDKLALFTEIGNAITKPPSIQ